MNRQKESESGFLMMLGVVMVLIGILAVLMLSGCTDTSGQSRSATLRLSLDCPEFTDMGGSSNGTTGYLPRNLTPPAAAMEIKEYRVTGTGPEDMSFGPLTSENGNLQLEGLLQGKWTITAEAISKSGVTLAKGTATVFLSATTNTATIILDRLPGTGTLTVTYGWNTDQVTQDVELELQLVDQSGSPVTLTPPTLDKGAGTATLSQTLAAGSYTLHSRLKAQGTIISGAVEAIRIVDSSVSSGNIDMVIGDRGNGFQITVVNDTLLPLQGTVTCSPVTPGPNTAVTLTFVPAVLPSGVLPSEISATWYCEGASIPNATGFSYICTPRAGTHRYDIVVSHEKLGSIGSAKIMVEMPFK